MPVSLRPDHLEFALRLDAELAEPDASRVWSPYSVAAALGLTASGAAGRTREELTALLGADLDGHLAALDRAVAAGQNEEGPDLATMTGLYVRQDLPLRPGFEARLRARPESGVYTADFEGDPEGVRHGVNSDVSKVTRGLITELLGPGTVSRDLEAMLVNALWVRLLWTTPFEAKRTRPRLFHTAAGGREVPMMHRRGRLPYAEAAGWRMATLEGEHGLELDLLLPADEDARPARAPGPRELTALYRAASSTDVQLALPRFELTHRRELVPPLAGAGVRTAFGRDADLSGISERPLKVDRIIHQARLRVDERGAEGAAATAVMMTLASAVPAQPVHFTADRPFVFVLRRREAVLFLGRVADPEDPGPAR